MPELACPCLGQWLDVVQGPATGQSLTGYKALTEEALIVIYRPRDNQYVLPFVPPAERLLSNLDLFAEVYLDSVLITQLRSRTYFSIRVPPGSHTLFVSPYADQNPMLEYRSASMDIEAQPGTTQFIDVRMEAGKDTSDH